MFDSIALKTTPTRLVLGAFVLAAAALLALGALAGGHGKSHDKAQADIVANLLKPENKAELTKILTYHVVPGKVKAADVVKLTEAKTVQGQAAKITVKDGKVMVDGATVTATDIGATNGVIHVIDTVILPN